MAAAKRVVAVTAVTTFAVDHDDRTVVVQEGERLPGNHPLVKAHPGLFSPPRPVEKARAAPA